MVHGFQNDFTRHKILIDLEVRGFEVRGLSKVHLAAVLKALLYTYIFYYLCKNLSLQMQNIEALILSGHKY